jgi:hypothetical protein
MRPARFVFLQPTFQRLANGYILESGLQNGATDLCPQEGVERGGMHRAYEPSVKLSRSLIIA